MACLSNKNTYLVFGIGITGKAVVNFLQQQKLHFYVANDDIDALRNFNLDEKLKIYDLNEQSLRQKGINFLILSPSVHAQDNPHKAVLLAKKLGVQIIPDIDLFYEHVILYNQTHNTDKKIIAITGTNGKSTTTVLTAFLFNQIGKSAIACGNTGLNALSVDVDKYDYFVVEMSSYNLFLMKHARFDSGVLLNITKDHLEYHGNMENYIDAKIKAIKQAEKKVLCIDSEYTKNAIEKITNSKEDKNEVVCVSKMQILKNGWSWQDDTYYYNGVKIFTGSFQNLPGLHNVENIICSIACVAETLGVNNDVSFIKKIFEKVSLFNGLPHRLQFIRTIDSVDFVNDSKATNADSTQKALQAFNEADIYLIAGGRRKTEGFLSLKNDLKNVTCVFLIGEASDSFAEELNILNIKYIKCQNMRNAVKNAFNMAKQFLNVSKKKTVLLSPLCASFDQYNSFEERGQDFIQIVNAIAENR